MKKLCVVTLGAVLFGGNAIAQVDPVAPNVPGYVPVKIVPGTNVIENLPFTAAMLPRLASNYAARKGDTICWKGESHTFDGKAWSGDANALVPIHESFTIIRTAAVTNVWNVGGELDLKKAEKTAAGDNKRTTTSGAVSK